MKASFFSLHPRVAINEALKLCKGTISKEFQKPLEICKKERFLAFLVLLYKLIKLKKYFVSLEKWMFTDHECRGLGDKSQKQQNLQHFFNV